MRILLLVTLVIVLSCASGCASVGTYFKDRGNDLADCFMARVSAGVGVSAYVECTRFGPGTSGGFSFGYKTGFIGREVVTTFDVLLGLGALGARAYFFGLPENKTGYMQDACVRTWLCMADGFYYGLGRVLGLGDNKNRRALQSNFISNQHFRPDSDPGSLTKEIKTLKHMFWIEAELFCFVGINLGFNVYEFADFLLGWTALDIVGDDAASLAEAKKKEPKE